MTADLGISPRASLAEFDRLSAAAGLSSSADVPMARFTSLRVGGPADRLVEVHSRAELLSALEACRAADAPWSIVGNGTDLLVADSGMRGVVIRNRARFVEVDGTAVSADAGTPMALLVRAATAAGLTGVEFGASIPGTLGGAVWANAGAHGSDLSEVVEQVEVWRPDDGTLIELGAGACGFGYRESRFKHSVEVVIGATVRLQPGSPSLIAERLAAIRSHRLATQPLDQQNAGSVFRNPDGDHAGRLIEAAGLKGFRIGGAEVSKRHANFIVTERGAQAADVRALVEHVRSVVADRFGVLLELEIDLVGDWGASR